MKSRSKDLKLYFDSIAIKNGLKRYHRAFKTDFIRSEGIEIHLDVIEIDKNAPTVIFMHGISIYSLCYSELLYKISQAGFNVIGVDSRGHGRSGGKRGDYTINELVFDLKNIVTYAINRFNEEISILGSSLGGIVSFYAAASDERIKSIICHGIAILEEQETFSLMKHPGLVKLISKFGNLVSSLLPASKIPITSYINLKEEHLRYFGNVHEFFKNDPLALDFIRLRSLMSFTYTKLARPVSEIATPIFIIQPEKDSIFSIEASEKILGRLNAKKKLKTYKGRSHNIFINDADIVLPDILNWLNRVHHYKAGSKINEVALEIDE